MGGRPSVKQFSSSAEVIRFHVFEVDTVTGELRKHGLRIKLQEQPFQVLCLLLARPGELVTREELRKMLWPADTFVDFEHGLNKTINKLREALSDDRETTALYRNLAATRLSLYRSAYQRPTAIGAQWTAGGVGGPA